MMQPCRHKQSVQHTVYERAKPSQLHEDTTSVIHSRLKEWTDLDEHIGNKNRRKRHKKRDEPRSAEKLYVFRKFDVLETMVRGRGRHTDHDAAGKADIH